MAGTRKTQIGKTLEADADKYPGKSHQRCGTYPRFTLSSHTPSHTRSTSMAELLRLVVHNYRCLRDVDFVATNINVVFGPNGVGKTTFPGRPLVRPGLRPSWHGRGRLLAPPRDWRPWPTTPSPATSGSILASRRARPPTGSRSATPRAGSSRSSGNASSRSGVGIELVNRVVGSDQAAFYHEQLSRRSPLKLRDPEKLAFSNFLLFCEPEEEAIELDLLLEVAASIQQQGRKPLPVAPLWFRIQCPHLPVGSLAEPLVRSEEPERSSCDRQSLRDDH